MTFSSVCGPRWATQRTDRPTYGPQAARFAEQLGIRLMPWQRQVLDVALEHEPGGRLAYRDVVLTVPRQSGKTTLLLVLILWRSLFWDAQVSVYTAQSGVEARQKWFDEWLPTLEHSPLARFFKPRKATGSEALLFTNGSRQHLIATTDSAGHGKSVDLAVLDEVFSYPDARLEQAMKPAMMTRAQPQLWVVSTAGVPGESPYLWAKVEAGRAAVEVGQTEGVAYFEWSAPDEADIGDPVTWRACMPALGDTVSEEAVRSSLLTMLPNEFARAYLNRWTLASTEPVIPLKAWAECLDGRSQTKGPLWFAVDVASDRSSASIAVCGERRDGLAHLEVVDTRSGTAWVAPRLVELRERHECVGIAVDKGGPAKSLLPDLERLGVDATEVSATDYAAACGFIYDAVLNGKLRHLDDHRLVTAIDGAKKRTLSDAWAWVRRTSGVDITPLVAVTLALWAHSQYQPVAAGGLIDPNDYDDED